MDHSDKVKRTPNPRENANIFSLITFLYTRRLFTRGFKKDLEDDDLYEVIKTCRSDRCAEKLDHVFVSESKKSKPSIIRVLWNTYGFRYLLLGTIHLVVALVTNTLEPDAIANLVAYFKPGQLQMTLHDAYYYAGILIGLKCLHSLYHPNYDIYLIQFSIQIRTSFSSLIYRKALKLNPKMFENASLGNIVTLLTKDVKQFESAIMVFNGLWVGIIQMFYISYLIYNKAGFASTIGILILASAIPVQIYIAKITKNLRLKQNKKTDVRLQETQEALSTIKTIKMYTWEKIFCDRIGETRRKEIKLILVRAITRFILMVSSDIMAKIGFFAIVMLYIYFNANMKAETIFYIMRSYATLRGSIAMMFTFGFTLIGELLACLQRIDNLLQLDELPEHVDKPDDDPQIDIRAATLTIKDKDLLKEITFKREAGLHVVTGQLGSGKSMLIKTILREYPIDSGEIRTRGRLSYASQDPWLFPATIKQNILFGEHYDFERYNKVIQICALNYDLSILEKSDETILTDRGMNLSKGQQARVNLARAIYKDSDIYLLDDSLTALDPKVQDQIFEECVRGFLKGKLVLLVTHNINHISQADTVTVLEHGTIKYTGGRQELSEKIIGELEEKIEIIDESREIEEKSKDEEANETSKLIKEPTHKKQIYHENKKEGGVAFETYAAYIRFGGGILFLLLIIFMFAASTFSDSTSQVMLTNWINHKTNVLGMKDKYFGNTTVNVDNLYESYFGDPLEKDKPHDVTNNTEIHLVPNFIWNVNNTITSNETFSPLNRSSLTESQNKTYYLLRDMGRIEMKATKSLNFYAILVIASVVIEITKQYCMLKFTTNASINIHQAIINSVIFSKMSFFDTYFIGNILNRFSQDLGVVDEYLPMILSLVIMCIFAFGGIIGIIASVSWNFVIPAIAILVTLVLLRHIYMPTARSLKRLEGATRSPIVGHLNSTMEGLATVRAFKAQNILIQEFDKHQDVYTSAKYTALCAKNALHFTMDCTSVAFIIYIIFRFLFIDTTTAAGDVGLTLTQAGALTGILQFGLMQLAEAESLMTSVERVMEYSKIEPEKEGGLETPNWPTAGEIVYDNVSLKYNNTNEKILKNISFSIKPQEKIGIVGRTGAGKSSIISTLFRLYTHEGAILIDGVDINTLSLTYLRQHISIIPQDPIMFSGTVRSNIDPLKSFSDEEIWKVLHKVNLDSKVPNLDTLVEDTNFSSGERQLLSLARSIVKKNRIVVLDEATANMDHDTEKMVQSVIDANFSSCTVIIIAHRLDSVMKCNKVMVLNRGEIIEFDDPTTLLNNETSEFSKMMKHAEMGQ